MGRWIPFRYYVVDFNKENQFWLCLQNQPTLHTLIHRHQAGQYIIRRKKISSCCLFALKRKKKARNWKSEIRPIFHEELLHRCSVVFFYKRCLQFYLSFFHEKNVTSRKNVIKSFVPLFFFFAQGFIKPFHTYCIQSLGMAPTAFSLLLSGFIRKMWLLLLYVH